MSYWHVSNHKLYSGSNSTDVSNPVFIVGTEFAFDNIYPSNTDPTNFFSWTNLNFQANRAAAGNSVFFDHCSYLGNPGAYPGQAAQRIINAFQQHYDVASSYKLKYFTFDVDLFGGTGVYFDDAKTSGDLRGQHTWNATGNMTNGNGHWTQIPRTNDGINTNFTVEYDKDYYNAHSNFNNTTYWWPDGQYGNSTWHTNYLKTVRTGVTNTTNHYDRLYGWHLMDEPFGSNDQSLKRDWKTNHYSVSGHYDFCSAVENSGTVATRPKMVGIRRGSDGAYAVSPDSCYNALSAVTDIINPNDYGSADSDRWKVPNSVKWGMSKISGSTTKMVMPWLPGNANELESKYCFYASLIEGARGVNWWMMDGPDYRNYTHQKTVYGMFTNNPYFNGTNNYPSDETIFLSGTDVPVDYLFPTQAFSHNSLAYYTGTQSSPYTGLLNTKCSVKAFSHNGKWRIYVVNHTTTNVTFTAEFSSYAPSVNALIRDTSNSVTMTNLPSGRTRIEDQISGLRCKFYNVN